MNKFLALCLKIIAAAGFVVCAAWTYKTPDFEPIAATLGCLSGFIALFIVERRSKPKPPAMHQRGGKKSKNYQSAGNITINPKK